MRPDIGTQGVMSLLQNLGLRVEAIPKSSEPRISTPDLRIACPTGDVLIEVKSKKDDKHLRELMDAPQGTMYRGPPATIKNRIRHAWHQIRDYPERTDTNFTVVWYITRKPHGMTILTQFSIVPILYGTKFLEGTTGANRRYGKPCFFFHRNRAMFARYRELDAVVIHDDQILQLCLNPLSQRYSSLRNTHFAQVFDTHFNVVDPPKMEHAGTCFIADPLPDGGTRSDVVRCLKVKYDLNAVTICTFVPFNDPVE